MPQTHQVHLTVLTITQHICSMKQKHTKYTQINTNKSTHDEMRAVWQLPQTINHLSLSCSSAAAFSIHYSVCLTMQTSFLLNMYPKAVPFLPRCIARMQRGLTMRKLSVSPSVCQTCDLWRTKRNLCSHSYTTWKIIYPSFVTRKMADGATLLPEILGHTDPVEAK